MIEEKSRFIDFLNYQISVKNKYYNKVPEFNKQLDELDFKLGLKESVLALKRSYETKRRRDVFATVVEELNYLVKKKKKE